MARSSGAVSPLVVVSPGEVSLSSSGARYQIDEHARVHFDRGGISGDRDAAFFIGSGAAARSFLWFSGGFAFELPVTWYASKGWEMSPGYETSRTLNLARPIEPECLNCHATGVRHRSGTRNEYDWPPALEDGIGCERCHGPGGEHAALGAKDAIVNPARLAPRLRDSVCAQCHLNGAERVARAGRDLADFRPGQDFADYAVSFVRTGPPTGELHVTSQFERLANSRCKQVSGDGLWCGSCHDPHSTPAPEQRAAYYREKCMACHQESAHATEHAECTSCHMPSRHAKDAPHATFTDHSIPRHSEAPQLFPAQPVSGGRAPGGRDLIALGADAGPRELGLAWARIANAGGQPEDFQRALELLRHAYDSGQRDAALLTALAYLEDREGNEDHATNLYEQVRESDPSQAEALVNLGSSYAAQGRIDEAIDLWREATQRSPGIEAAWIKLALASAAGGNVQQALEAARACLQYHPDSPEARDLLKKLDDPRR